MSISVPLTKGLIALIDECDAERVLARKWHAITTNDNPYAAARINKKVVLLHRFILNAPKGTEIDHKNHNGLDCRRDNLRFASRSQNRANVRRRCNKSGYRGVYRTGNDISPWQALISVAGKIVYLGSFVDPVDAARAYDERALSVHGEFATLNFPESSSFRELPKQVAKPALVIARTCAPTQRMPTDRCLDFEKPRLSSDPDIQSEA